MPTIGLSIIARNESASIRQCLLSVRGLVDQIVVADTGSTDRTAEIAREYGAVVIDFPWQSHFANARNAALVPLTTDWVLSLDADEELDREAARELPNLLSGSSIAGYILPIRNYSPAETVRAGNALSQPNDRRHSRAESARSFFIYEKCRLFQRRKEIYFTGRIHEQVEVSIREHNLKLSHKDLIIHNFGLLMTRGDMGEKLVRYRDLLRMRTDEEPGDFRGWTYLGRMEYDSFNNRSEALRCFQRALQINPGCVEALLFTAMIYLDLGRADDAKCFLEFRAPDAEGEKRRLQLLGDACCKTGDLERARSAFVGVFEFDQHNAELQSLIGLIEMKLAMPAGFQRLRAAAEKAPNALTVQDNLMKGYFSAGMMAEAALVAERIAEITKQPRAFLRAASLHAHLTQWSDSKRILERGLQLTPHSEDLQRALSETLVASRPPSDR